MYNKFATPDIEEEKARLKALVDTLNEEDDEEDDTKAESNAVESEEMNVS